MYRLLEVNEPVQPDDEFWGVLDGWKPVPKYAVLAGDIITKENGPVRRKVASQQVTPADGEEASENPYLLTGDELAKAEKAAKDGSRR